MDGGCITVWVEKELTHDEKRLLKEYVAYLLSYEPEYSFSYEYSLPEIKTRHERRQDKRLPYVV